MNPHEHPLCRCPYCGCAKPVVSWRACSQFCADYMQGVPRQQWRLPDAPLGTEEPETLWTADR